MKPSLRIAMIGYMFMGRAHSQAWSSVVRAFDPSLRPCLAVLCGPEREEVQLAADRLGWASIETDWRAVVERKDVDVVDICAPVSLHAPIAVAALEAGKHVFCEKPLALSGGEAESMAEAAARASLHGTRSMVGFNYRRVPALAYARRLVEAGRIGEPRQLRAAYLQDWLFDAAAPWSWRVSAVDSGSGVLGDIGSHIVDLTQFLLDDRISDVTGITKTFVTKRPLPKGQLGEPDLTGVVDVPDAAMFLARFNSGVVGTFEATRVATGHKNSLRVEVNGSLGSISFDLERLNELEFYDARDTGDEQGFRRILVTESTHPFISGWWPPGHVLGWEHAFANELSDFLDSIAAGMDPSPGFREGCQVQHVLDAVQKSQEAAGWVPVGGGSAGTPAIASSASRES
jgi:predicted dehydrogenase